MAKKRKKKQGTAYPHATKRVRKLFAPIYFVQLRLNLDDVMMGCYLEKAEAINRAERLAAHDQAAFWKATKAHCSAWDVSGLTDGGIQVWRMRGPRPATMVQSFTPFFVDHPKDPKPVKPPKPITVTLVCSRCETKVTDDTGKKLEGWHFTSAREWVCPECPRIAGVIGGKSDGN
jgi:hypothetical protein